MNPDKKQLKKGVSILEVIIAMALIIFISGTSIGIMSVFNQASIKSSDQAEAVSMIENVKEMFRYADSETEFEAYLNDVVDIEISNIGTIYSFSELNYNGYFQVSYDETAKVATFSALLKDAENKVMMEIDPIERKLYK